MIKTLIMLGLVCLLAIFMMMDFIIVIPKLGSKHFGAPDDIKEMMEKIPDRASWVNIIGVCIMIVGFVGVIAVFIWAMVDTVKTDMSFFGAFIRFSLSLKDINYLISYFLIILCLQS